MKQCQEHEYTAIMWYSSLSFLHPEIMVLDKAVTYSRHYQKSWSHIKCQMVTDVVVVVVVPGIIITNWCNNYTKITFIYNYLVVCQIVCVEDKNGSSIHLVTNIILKNNDL